MDSSRIKERFRLEGTSGGHLFQPLCSSRALELVAQDHVQVAFQYVQGESLHDLPGQPVTLKGKKVFPDVQREPPVFLFVPTAAGPVTGHHWKEPGSVFFAPSLQVFAHVEDPPCAFSSPC